TTPLQMDVPAGAHTLLLKDHESIDARYTLHVDEPGTGLHAMLWRRQPLLTRLRSTLPGAALSDARFLADGEVALSLSLPTGQRLQAWRLDSESGAVEPILVDGRGTRLVVSPDARFVALLGSDVGPPPGGDAGALIERTRPSVVWLFEAGRDAPIT